MGNCPDSCSKQCAQDAQHSCLPQHRQNINQGTLMRDTKPHTALIHNEEASRYGMSSLTSEYLTKSASEIGQAPFLWLDQTRT